jgi:hypothetical protein
MTVARSLQEKLMPPITIKNGVVSAVAYVQVTREQACDCGAKNTITMSMPEGVSYTGAINVKANCPSCGKPVTIPHGHHYIENFKLLTKSLA